MTTLQRLAVDGGDPVITTPLDFSKGAGLLGTEEREAVLEVLESRSLFRYYGPQLLGKVAAFEQALARSTGTAFAVATSSGTAALRCALAALGVGCGDEVVVPSFTFIATVNAVVVAGAVPVFAEIDDSLGLDPADLSAKNVTTGEGGALVTSDEQLYLRAARYQDQGGQFVTSHMRERGGELDDPFVGENLRMAEIAGAIAGVQLDKLPGLLERLRANCARVAGAVGTIDAMVPRRVPDPEGAGGSSLTWFLPDPELARRFTKALRAEGVPCAQMYGGKPVYANRAILERRTATLKGGPWHCAEHPSAVEYRMGMCPVTEELVGRSVIVPIGPAWSPAECEQVADAVRKVAAGVLS